MPGTDQTPTVTLLTPCDFSPGQRITITAGPRKGDWLVVAQSERKITLQCPISGREFTWDRFCYLAERK